MLYPRRFPSARRRPYYVARFSTVELDTTVRRMPAADNPYRRGRRVAMPARSGQTSSVCNLSSASPSCFSAQGFSTMSVTPSSRSSSSSIGSD